MPETEPILETALMIHLAMWGWIPLVAALFVCLPPRRAVIAAFVIGWLFLPIASFKVEGLPAYNKFSAIGGVVTLMAVLFDGGHILRVRPRWLDLPMIAWCLCPMVSSLANDLGVYDGASGILGRLLLWGFPYWLGRTYLTDAAALRELAIGLFLGGLVYVPLCLFEIRMSPQLHNMVYGYHQHQFGQTVRWGGYRPTVFTQHGLALGMWMTAASLVGVWLWTSGSLRRLCGVPMAFLVPPLLLTTLLCKSSLALALLLTGLGLVALVRVAPRSAAWVALILALVAPLYVAARLNGMFTGDRSVATVASFSADRAQSLEYRFRNENLLMEKAMLQPFFGWGGWGRSRIVDEEKDKDISATDSLWVIALGQNGLLGLGAVLTVLFMPIAVWWWRCPGRYWSHPALAPLTALTIVLMLYSLDNTLNSMSNSVFFLAIGGLMSAPTLFAMPRPLPPSEERKRVAMYVRGASGRLSASSADARGRVRATRPKQQA